MIKGNGKKNRIYKYRKVHDFAKERLPFSGTKVWNIMLKPVQIEVVAPMLSSVEMSCNRCGSVNDFLGLTQKYREACIREYPDDWKEAVDFLSRVIEEISRLYRHRIRIRVIDAQSPLGLWKQLRYRFFRFPAFIIEQKKTYVGWDSDELSSIIDTFLHPAPVR